jgi:hypothetical protein
MDGDAASDAGILGQGDTNEHDLSDNTGTSRTKHINE